MNQLFFLIIYGIAIIVSGGIVFRVRSKDRRENISMMMGATLLGVASGLEIYIRIVHLSLRFSHSISNLTATMFGAALGTFITIGIYKDWKL
jgi:uncharacterized integral membrane protein